MVGTRGGSQEWLEMRSERRLAGRSGAYGRGGENFGFYP